MKKAVVAQKSIFVLMAIYLFVSAVWFALRLIEIRDDKFVWELWMGAGMIFAFFVASFGALLIAKEIR